jgi:potassium-transporting ATPase KdpC subunit
MATRLPGWVRQHLAAVRALAVLTVLLGLVYPLAVTGIAQLPGLKGRADGSLVRVDGQVVGSRLLGQSFTTEDGTPLRQYFQSRPSAGGYDPGASGASNLGPEDVLDTPDRPSLLTDVCARSAAVGELEGVSGARPFCTPGGVGAVLVVLPDAVVSANEACPATPFTRSYQGRPVVCRGDQDLALGQVVPVRGDAPADPVVPADAVTASGSGLDPQISPAYAALQVPRVARERGLPEDRVRQLVADATSGRALGFLGEPAVNVLELNLALDRTAPVAR